MKRIDRYILASFARNYVASLAVLVGLYVMMDAFFNFDEISRGEEGVGSTWEAIKGILLYYLAQGLFIYGQLAGVIPVVAAAFTLMRMSRFNELTALLAAGVPLVRVAAPVVLAAAAINLIVQPINQELIVPKMAGYLTLERWEAASGERQTFGVEPTPAGDGSVFMAAAFTPASVDGNTLATAVDITVIDRASEARLGLLTAKEATFDPIRQAWLLVDGRRVNDLLERGGAGTMAMPEWSPVEIWETAASTHGRRAGPGVGSVGRCRRELLRLAQHETASRPVEPGSGPRWCPAGPGTGQARSAVGARDEPRPDPAGGAGGADAAARRVEACGGSDDSADRRRDGGRLPVPDGRTRATRVTRAGTGDAMACVALLGADFPLRPDGGRAVGQDEVVAGTLVLW